jgi:hypothetical protein
MRYTLTILMFFLMCHAKAQDTVKVNCKVHSMTEEYKVQSGWTYDTSYNYFYDTTWKYRCGLKCLLGFKDGKSVVDKIQKDSIAVVTKTPAYTTVLPHDTLISSLCDSLVYTAKIGVLVNSEFLDIYQKPVIVADSLKSGYVRDAINIDVFLDKGKSNSYEANLAKGLGVIVNINSVQQNTGAQPFLTDTALYADRLDLIFSKYHEMKVAVPDNEPFNRNYHTGPMQLYCNMQMVFARVAHKYGVKCSDGGMYRIPLEILAYRYFDSTKQFASRDSLSLLMAKGYVKAAITKGLDADMEQKVFEQFLILNTDKLMFDYANVHMYQDSQDTSLTTEKIKGLLTYLQKYVREYAGLPLITNEFGQRHNTDSTVVRDLLRHVTKLNMPYALWFSGDDGNAGAMALTNKDGSLRLNGVAFRNFEMKR